MLGAKMTVNSTTTDLCRATTCLSIIVLDSHPIFIDGALITHSRLKMGRWVRSLLAT